MPIEKTPYEFLVRFKKDGAISGAHIKFFETISEGGVKLLEREGLAQPVETANEAGFPMGSVLSAIHVGAIAAFDAEVIAHAATSAAKDKEINEARQEAAEASKLLEQTRSAANALQFATMVEKKAEIAAIKQEAAAAIELLQRRLNDAVAVQTDTANRLIVAENQLAALAAAAAASTAG